MFITLMISGLILAGCSSENAPEENKTNTQTTVVTSAEDHAEVSDTNDNSEALPESHTVLVVGGGSLYDLKSGELFEGGDICEQYALSEGDTAEISCIIMRGNSEIEGSYCYVSEVLSCEKTAFSSVSADSECSVTQSAVGLDIVSGLIDITDPSDGGRTVIFCTKDNGLSAVSDRWEGVRHYKGYIETDRNELFLTNDSRDSETAYNSLINGTADSEDILFAGYLNDPLENCEIAYFSSEDFTDTAKFVFNASDDYDDMLEKIREKGFAQEVTNEIASMDICDGKSICVICGIFSIDPKYPVIINSRGCLAPSKGDTAANIIVLNADSRLFENTAE